MKICPVCDLQLEDSYSFCPEDGSSLQNRVRSDSIIDPPTGQSDNGMHSVVLCCPNCAAEYPLTFSECPVHGVTLTKHTRPTARSQSASVASVLALSAAAGLQFVAGTDPSTTNIHSVDSPSDAPKIADRVNSTESISQDLNRFPDALRSFENASDERPGFRIAAIITAIALAIFAIASLYGLINHLSRRPSTVAQIAKAEDVRPLPFVATPQEAQDYTDEQPSASEPSAPSQPAAEPLTERHNNDVSPARPPDQRGRKMTTAQTSMKPAASTTAPQPREDPASMAPAPALPRVNSGGFDSRLIRERGSRTSSGYRYELTFNMLEQGGRSAQWQRVLISSHSASGINHTQALPFVHRLGAAGALTFTISVELAGRSEPDWRGRVICTALGWDNSGAPLQSSFGANLTP
jgi:hypothetical protein